MGNGSKQHRPKKQALPKSALVSGEVGSHAAGGGAGTQFTEEVTIPLVMLVEATVLASPAGTAVEIRLLANQYVAFVGEARLGTVPSHYAPDLLGRDFHRGRLIERGTSPLKAIVQVRLRA